MFFMIGDGFLLSIPVSSRSAQTFIPTEVVPLKVDVVNACLCVCAHGDLNGGLERFKDSANLLIKNKTNNHTS